MVEIDDDDFKVVSEADLEKKSLENAEKGIVLVEDDEVLMEDGYAAPSGVVVSSEEKLETHALTTSSTNPASDFDQKRADLIR